ncbi:histidinol-phosphate transaminase [Mesobacillus foraminis]|uniref:histidinol-phosphate transaminase n=1 Tax=Mesobacillus foraminis TaxID=279826 RepID=UPI0039A2AF99
MNSTNLIRPRITLENIKPYKPGKPLWEVQKELELDEVIKLASNENPLGPSRMAIQAVSISLTDINRYPDSHAVELKKTIASKLVLSEDQLIVTNGADELITLISETYLDSGDEIIVPSPSFSEYDFGAHLLGATVVPVKLRENFEFDIEGILSAVSSRTKLIYVCSPNNPTGTYLPKDRLEELLNSLPKHVLVVFDSAYSHFATEEDYTDGLEYVRAGFPVMVLQTFSKVYGLAGLRIGFGVAPKEVIQSILKVKEPFNVNTLAQTAAIVAIKDEEHVHRSTENNTVVRKQLYDALSGLDIHYTESMANFVLVKIGPDAKFVYEQLLLKGVIVRYGDTWGMPDYIRISIGTEKENRELIEALYTIVTGLKLANFRSNV